jgi:hypothetical protein
LLDGDAAALELLRDRVGGVAEATTGDIMIGFCTGCPPAA